METHEADRIIREALDKVAPECPSPRIIYTRAYSYCGRACITPHGFQIKLSNAWKGATPEGKRQTLIHEAMHVADAFLHKGQWSGHGFMWQVLMRKVGARPDRCSNDPGALATANQALWHREVWVHCPCRSLRVSKRMRSSIAQNPGSKLCARCRKPLTANPEELAA